VANIVGSGDLNTGIDLSPVAEDIRKDEERIESVEHSRRRWNRLNIYFTEWDTLGVLAPTDVTIITGASSYEELYESNNDMIASLADIGLLKEPVEDGFGVCNIVFVGDTEQELNLNALAVGFGLEAVEYEPEQFPGLVYRPPDYECTVLIFATGKMVITGILDRETAQKAYEHVVERISELLGDI
jgi:transcription initiation factor TFIID TATA-box-binding protein